MNRYIFFFFFEGPNLKEKKNYINKHPKTIYYVFFYIICLLKRERSYLFEFQLAQSCRLDIALNFGSESYVIKTSNLNDR